MGGRPSSKRVRKQRVFEGINRGPSLASAKGGRDHFVRCALPTFPLRVACFTDHASARFRRTGKQQEDQDWEPPEVEEEREEEDLLELPPKKHTKTKTTKVCMLQPST